MDKHLEHQLTDILARIDQETDIPTLHVILMDGPGEDREVKQVIESTVEAPEVHPFMEASPPPSNHPPVSWLVGFLATLPTLVLISLLFLPALLPVVRVTLVPVTRMITAQAEVTVTTSEIIREYQIAGRLLSSLTLKDAKTVPTTGVRHQEARVSHGLITFYNAALFSQTIPAGTLLTATSGVQIVTDQSAVIPPGSLSTNGQVTVSAHAVESGPSGNIVDSDLYGPCCRVNVFVTNGPFSGGQAATTYQAVSEQDIEQTAQMLKASLKESAETALISQVKQDETLITPPACTSLVTPDHKAGEQAKEVTVTVEYQCQGMTYQTKAMQTVMQKATREQAASELGTGYTRTGEISISVTSRTDVAPEQRVLSVKAAGQWVYQFSPGKLDHLKEMIAGKSYDLATALLLKEQGVAEVTFDTKQMNILPVEPSRIDVRTGFAF